MKKSLAFFLLLMTNFQIAGAQVCTLDTFTIPGIYPDTLVNLPKGYANASYGTVIQIRVFTDTTTAQGNVVVTDITVNSVTGLPPGFSYACFPANCAFPGGGNGCMYLSGNPTPAHIGTYNLVVNVTLHGKLFNLIPVSQASQILGYKITILGAPVADFSGSPVPVCKGATVTYSDLSTNLPTSWLWTFPGGTPSTSTLQNPIVTYNTAGTYSSTLVATNPAGNNSITKNGYITVQALPVATVSPSGSQTICQGSSVLLSSSTGAGYSYQWIKNGADIPGATASTYAASGAGTYKVRVTNPNGCSKESSGKSVTVSNVNATATANGTTTFCSGGNVLLTANTGNGLIYQWKKDNVNISGATASSYQASASGTYKVVVTKSNGCSKVSNGVAVTVNNAPQASFTANGPLTFCAGGSVIFTANSGNNQSYQWKRNGNNINGATQINYTATTAGTYKVVVTKTNGCSKASNGKTVIINCREGQFAENSKGILNALLFPNPADGKVTLQYTLYHQGNVMVRITDLNGRKIMQTLQFNNQTEGIHELEISTSSLLPGIYLVNILNEGVTENLKLSISRN